MPKNKWIDKKVLRDSNLTEEQFDTLHKEVAKAIEETRSISEKVIAKPDKAEKKPKKKPGRPKKKV